MNETLGKRNWKTWPRRFIESGSIAELLVGLTSLACTVFGTLASQPYLQIPGVLVLLGAPILVAYRSFPERLLSVPSLATSQRQITLEQLHQLDTPVVILGTVGETQSGRARSCSTLLIGPLILRRLLGSKSASSQFQSSSSDVLCLSRRRRPPTLTTVRRMRPCRPTIRLCGSQF